MAMVEVAIAMFNSGNPLGARVGSIVEARQPLGMIGSKERLLYLWMQVEGPDEEVLLGLKEHRYQDPGSRLILVHKYRWEVPVAALQGTIRGFELLRAMNPLEVYQPTLNLDARTGRYSARVPAMVATLASERVL